MNSSKYSVLLITVLAVVPIALSLATWKCSSPVSLHLKSLGVDYSFEKGICTIPDGTFID